MARTARSLTSVTWISIKHLKKVRNLVGLISCINASQIVRVPKPNKWFEEAGAGDVFGAAVIFKVKEPAFDDHGEEVVYDHLDRNSIKNAFEDKGIAADDSLKWLAAQ